MAIALLGCGQSQVVGYACPPAGCQQEEPELSPPDADCSMLIEGPVVEVPQDREICSLHSLEELGSPEELVYLTRVEAAFTPHRHHLDVRLAPRDDLDPEEFPDGVLLDCQEIWQRSVSWEPLISAQDSAQPEQWGFEHAPFAASLSHRVFINQHYANSFETVARVGVDLSIECTRERPPIASRAFVFVQNSQQVLAPATTYDVQGACSFNHDVALLRLFRRTHQIGSFEVRMDDGSGAALWSPTERDLCTGSDPWRCDFLEPLPVPRRVDLEFTCHYENLSDHVLELDGSADACALFGVHILPSDADPLPMRENCFRR